MSGSREGCCADRRQPCAYHEGWQDCLDELEARRGQSNPPPLYDEEHHPATCGCAYCMGQRQLDALLTVMPEPGVPTLSPPSGLHHSACNCFACYQKRREQRLGQS